MLDGLSRQLGGGGEGAAGQGGGSGLDVKSLLGGGALGLLVGSRRGRKLGGKALKYGALAGVGALAWKAWQNSRGAGGASPAEGEPVERLGGEARRSEEHTSELQSRPHLVCRLLLEKKKSKQQKRRSRQKPETVLITTRTRFHPLRV